MKNHFHACIVAFALMLLVVESAPVKGAEPAPKQPAVKKNEMPPVLTMDIHPAKGGMEAEFRNNTAGEVGVKVGKRLIRLKPGEAGRLQIQKQEELHIYERISEDGADKWRPRVSTLIFPRLSKAQFLGPR